MVERRRLDKSLAGDLGLGTLCIIGLVLSLGAVLADAPVARTAPPAGVALGRVGGRHNEVRRRFARSLVWESLPLGARVFVRDAVYVGPDSSATLTLDDGSQIDIDESSLVYLDAVDAGTTAAPANYAVEVRRGGASGRAGSGRVALRAGAGAADVGAGGRATVRLAADRSASVTAQGGEVLVRGAAGTTRALPAGAQQRVAADGAVDGARTPTIRLTAPAPGERWRVNRDRRVIDFGWEPSAGRGPYLLEIASDASFSSIVARRETREVSWREPAIPPGVYTWRVTRPNGDEREWSEERQVVVVDDWPPVPYRPQADAVVDLSQAQGVVLSWGAVPDVDTYRVELARGRALSTPLLSLRVTGTVVVLRPEDVALEEGGHCMQVRSDGPGRADSPWSDLVCFRIVTRPVLRAPEIYAPATDSAPRPPPEQGFQLWHLFGSVAHAAETEIAPVLLRWEKLGGAVAYVVEIAADEAFSSVLVQERVSTNVFRWTPPARRLYFYRVRGVDAEGREGMVSVARPVEADLPTPVSSAPAARARFELAGKHVSVRLVWAASPSFASYVVEVSRDATFSEPVTSVPTAATSHDLDVSAVGEHFWRVFGIGRTGQRSMPSAVRSFVVGLSPPQPLQPASDLQPVAAGGGGVELAWTRRAASQYEVVVATDPRLANVAARLKSATSSARAELQAPGRYFWRVRALLPPSDWGGVATFLLAPPAPSPSAPADGAVIAAGPEGAAVRLSWTPVAGVTRYRVEVARAGGPPGAPGGGEPVVAREVEAAELEVELGEGRFTWRASGLWGDGLTGAWSAPASLSIERPAVTVVGPPVGPPARGEPEPRLDLGAQIAFITNFGAVATARVGLGGELRFAWPWGHGTDAGVRLEYFTAATDFRDEGVAVASRLHAIPVTLQARYLLPAWGFEWAAGVGLVMTVAMATVRVQHQEPEAARALLWGGRLILGTQRQVGWGLAFVEVAAALGTKSAGAVTLDGERLAVVAGYRLPVW